MSERRGDTDRTELDRLEPEAEPTPEELAEAERLRAALDGGAEAADAELARALRAAWDPPALDPARHEALLARALAAAPRPERTRRAAVIVRVSFGAATSLAIAAAAMLFVRAGADRAAEMAAPVATAAESRPASDLFEGPFPVRGGTSERVDRLASARSRDFRANRFARWGVR